MASTTGRHRRPAARAGPSLMVILSDGEGSSGGDAPASHAQPIVAALAEATGEGFLLPLIQRGIARAVDAVSDSYDAADARGQVETRRLSISQNLLPMECIAANLPPGGDVPMGANDVSWHLLQSSDGVSYTNATNHAEDPGSTSMARSTELPDVLSGPPSATLHTTPRRDPWQQTAGALYGATWCVVGGFPAHGSSAAACFHTNPIPCCCGLRAHPCFCPL
jgi:hypothetical protein